MEKSDARQQPQNQEKEESSVAKKPFTEPKLTWIEPELVPHGSVETVAGFFGSFSPGS